MKKKIHFVMKNENCVLCSNPVKFSTFENKRVKLKEILDSLHISLEEDARFCQICFEKMDKVYTFKKSCLQSQQENINMLKNINLLNGNQEIRKDIETCQMCMKSSKVDVVSFFEFLENNNLQEFFEIHFPEIYLSGQKYSVICNYCVNEMKDFMDIKLKLPDETPSIGNLKDLPAHNRELIVKLIRMELSTNMVNASLPDPRFIGESNKNCQNGIQKSNINESKDPYYTAENNISIGVLKGGVEYFCEDCRIGGKCNHQFENVYKETEHGYFYCANCNYKSNYKYLLKCHMLVHKTPYETKMFKCVECSFKSKHATALFSHKLLHKNPNELKMYKCNYCDFETKHRSSIKGHLIVHKNKEEFRTYDCPYCNFKAKLPGNLRTHLISHQSPDSSKWYNCDKCNFKTRYKANFRRHLIVHQGPDEVKMIKCQFCDYQSKHLASVKKHLLCHDTGDVKVFKCGECHYETKHRNNYQRHLLTHKKYGESPMFKCPECNYETNNKQSLKTHRVNQHDPQARLFCCSHCKYKTTIKGNLNKHSIIHQNITYNCTFCDFKTKHKSSLKQHLLIHQIDAHMYDCIHCSFKTKNQMCLKNHMLVIHGINIRKDKFHLRKFKPPETETI